MKKILILIIAVFAITLTGCSKDKALISVSYDGLAAKIRERDSFVLYVGSSECSHCAEFRPVLEKVMRKYKLDIYYIDMAELSAAKYKAVMDKIDGRGTPTTVYIKKGRTLTSPRIEGESDYETVVEFFQDLGLVKGE
jgi:predicted bacteriocin transport accessory protein